MLACAAEVVMSKWSSWQHAISHGGCRRFGAHLAPSDFLKPRFLNLFFCWRSCRIQLTIMTSWLALLSAALDDRIGLLSGVVVLANLRVQHTAPLLQHQC